MAIPGIQQINIGNQNEAAGSDSLYLAFTKTKTNFDTLFACSSPYNSYTGNIGIEITANATAGIIDILNTGVNSIIAGQGIVIDRANGDVTIASIGGGGGGGGTVTSVAIMPASTSRLTVGGSPIISSGTILLDLATSGVTPGTYTYPTVNVDAYGRIIGISNAAAVGTVTSVGLIPGAGIQVTNSPVTTNGVMTITNAGVTKLTAGNGIQLSGSTGEITISTGTTSGTVTSVSLTSSSLAVTGSPIISSGVINVELPSQTVISNTLTVGNTVTAANILGNIVTPNQSNITTVGTLNALTVAGNIISGNIITNTGIFVGNGSGLTALTGSQIIGEVANANHSTYSEVAYNLNTYYGSFYGNVTQTNPMASAAMGITFNNVNVANGISITSGTKLVCGKPGVYNIQCRMQLIKTTPTAGYVEIWLAKNGSSIEWTNTRIRVTEANVVQTTSLSFTESIEQDGYFEIMWGSEDTTMQLTSISAANTTMNVNAPAVLVTINAISI